MMNDSRCCTKLSLWTLENNCREGIFFMSDLASRISSLSPEKRALLSQRLKQKKAASSTEPTVKKEGRQTAPLSFSQQRLWFLDELERGNPFYNEPLLAGRLKGHLNREVLQRALDEIVGRHEALRTVFRSMDANIQQEVLPAEPLPLPVVDLEPFAEDEREEQVQGLAVEEAQLPFDLARGPFLRARLLRVHEREHVLLLSRHHIASDAWSTKILLQEIALLYQSLVQGQPLPLPALPIQYTDFAIWQRNWLRGDVLERYLDYWKRHLADAPTIFDLPTDHTRPPIQSFRGEHQYARIDVAQVENLKELSRQAKATLFMTLLAAFEVLLYRYSRQETFLIGTPISGRTKPEMEQLIGFFSNTLVLRAELNGNPTFHEVLERVRTDALASYAYQDLPFEHLVETLQPERDLSRMPLVQVMFVFDNAPIPTLELPHVTIQPLVAESGTSKFDLTLAITEDNEGLELAVEYSTDLFEAETIRYMLDHYQIILRAALANPDVHVAEMPLLSEVERQRILVQWNTTEIAYPGEYCLHQLFEHQVLRQPDAIAAICGDEQVTYQELNDKANHVAHLLCSYGVGPNVVVGICVERSLDLVVGLLGILKAGGAYLPLDPTYPQDRLAFMLEDAHASVLLTQQRLLERLPPSQATILYLDADWETIAKTEQSNPVSGVTPEDMVYLIYTSGSTGRPKGVMLNHRGRVNNFADFHRRFAIGSGDRLLAISSPSFDMCAYDTLGMLMSGGTIVLPEAALERDPVHWAELMVRHKVTIWHSVPALLEALYEYVNGRRDMVPCSLRLVLLGGDWIPVTLPDRLKMLLPALKVISMGGATEASMDSTIYAIEETDPAWKSIPYGRPMANQTCYVLDACMQPVPVGIPGELHLGGIGLAWGYMNCPDLSAEKFVPHPFSNKPGDRLYKTGDLARYRHDGILELLGRMDYQVKIRGLRIELGEIESAIKQLEKIREAVVVANTDGHGKKRLVAYLVPQPGSVPTTEDIRQNLLQTLPEYMVPSAFVFLQALPLTPNGKVDRRHLPEPLAEVLPQGEFVAPRNAIEQVLADVWMHVLGVDRVGVHDNFFMLGGDSIRSIQVISRASQAGLRFTPRQLFQYQTIAELASVVEKAAPPPHEGEQAAGAVPLAPIQHWFFEKQHTYPHYWNQAFLFKTGQKLEPTSLQIALKHVLEHHDAFRLRFTLDASDWKQWYAETAVQDVFSVVDLSTMPEPEWATSMEKVANELHGSLNITQGPLVRMALFTTGQQHSYLLLIIHHLAIDGISWPILLEDLHSAYQQCAIGNEVRLPARSASFKSWAEHLERDAQSTELKKEAAYWLSEERKNVLPLPRDFAQITNTEESTQLVTISLSEEETQTLFAEALPVYRLQANDLLLAALAQACTRWTGQPLFLVNLDGSGRWQEVAEDLDLSRTMGWLTVRYPILLNLEGCTTNGQVLVTVKEQLRAVPNQGIGYGLLHYLCYDAEISEAFAALTPAEMSFAFLGNAQQFSAQDALFEVASASYGQIHHPKGERSHLLKVDWFLDEGKLYVHWSYSEQAHKRETIKALAQQFLQHVRTLMLHCLTTHERQYTPSDFPLAGLQQQDLNRLLVSGSQIEDIYPLSPMQQNMLYQLRHSPQPGLYVNQTSFSLLGALNAELFREAWQQIINNHPILRTTFAWEGLSRPLQIVHAHAEVAFQHYDWSDRSQEEQVALLEKLLHEERLRGFDPAQLLLMRLFLIKMSDDLYQFVKIDSYLLTDAWSGFLLRKELLDRYIALASEQPFTAEAPPLYRDYIHWLEQQDTAAAKTFWGQQLTGFSVQAPLLKRCLSSGKAGLGKKEYAKQTVLVSREATQALQALAR
jgi:amino acid adenylation domain-containing protein/non-ribosomal peptide synthase protein (TIGR01720 family)